MSSRRGRRRSISVKGLTDQRIGDYLESLPVEPGQKPKSKSGFLEDIINDKLDELGAPQAKEEDIEPPKKTGNKPSPKNRHGGIHVW